WGAGTKEIACVDPAARSFWNLAAGLFKTNAAGQLTAVPLSSFVETLLDDTTAGAFLTTLGVSAFAQTLLDDANAAAARTTLGVPSARTISGADTLVGSDNGGTVIVTASGATVALDAAATLGAGWRCRVIMGGDYDSLLYDFFNPNGSEQIDSQDLVVAYAGEAFDIWCDGSAFWTSRATGLVFFGETAASGSAVDLYQDSVFFDDPEIIGGEILLDGVSQSDGSWNLVLQAIDTAGSAITSDYATTSSTAFGTYAGNEATNASGITASVTNSNSGDQFSGFFTIHIPRGDNIFQAFGWTSIMRNAQTEATMDMFTGTRNDANAAGVRVTHANGGTFNGGVVRWYGLRARRA
ncbi:MAG: hypothetical protein AB7P02_14870, partial [Alphaproteobacteria bacterium]